MPQGENGPGLPGEDGRDTSDAIALIWPVTLLLGSAVLMMEVGSIAAAFGAEPDSPHALWVSRAFQTLFWLVLAFAAHRAIRIVFWERYVGNRTGVAPPLILVQLTGLVLFVAAVFIILSFVFDVAVVGLLTTSSILLAVIGFALRTMISDLFTGIALGIERPFKIGDWIELEDGPVGRIASMNWRATRLVTREEVTVIVANSRLATEHVMNYSAPHKFFRDEILITLDYSVTAWRAERLLLSAIWAVPEVTDVPRDPEIRIKEFKENGTVWRVRYWIPDYGNLHGLRYEVQRQILRNLHFSGVHIPGEKLEMRRLPDEREMRDIDFLHEIDFLGPLTEEEIMLVCDQMEHRLFRRNVPVVEQGQEGSSLFIVKEGMLTVNVLGKDGQETRVGTLTPGAFFGEMSLLTGEARGATVLPEVDSLGFEIKKETLEPILQRRPELAEHLSRTLAERQMRTREAFAAMDAESGAKRRQSMAQEFLAKMRSFFGL